jgi:hypothetical protein
MALGTDSADFLLKKSNSADSFLTTCITDWARSIIARMKERE